MRYARTCALLCAVTFGTACQPDFGFSVPDFGLGDNSLCGSGGCVWKSMTGQVTRASGKPARRAIVRAWSGWVQADADTTGADGTYYLVWEDEPECRLLVLSTKLHGKKVYQSDTIQACAGTTVHDIQF